MPDSPAKPRPRPKPKPRQAGSNSASRESGISIAQTTSSSSSSATPIVVDDGDDLFIKNRTRTVTTWAHWDEINKEKPKKRSNESDSGSDNDDVSSPRGRKYKKKRPGKDVPRWQKDKDFVRLLSQDVSEGSDSDGIEILGSGTTPGGSKARKGKGKARSRSRSITPPPALPLHQIQNARAVVRRALDIIPRESSPTIVEVDADESTDTIILAPELAQIAKVITAQPALHVPQPSGGPSDTVIMSVKWQPHPLNTAGKEEVWDFRMNRDDNFRDLFEAVAEEAAVLTESVIMSYEGKRIFSSVAPMTLNIWGRAELVACDKKTYEYIRKNPETTAHTFTYSQSQSQSQSQSRPPALTSNSSSSGDIITIDSDDSDSDDIAEVRGTSPPSYSHPPSDGQPGTTADNGDTFKLVLRSVLTAGKDIILTVRPTTKCAAIVRAFLKRAGLEDQYPNAGGAPTPAPTSAAKNRGRQSKGAAASVQKIPQLLVDGEKLSNESEIGDMDLEDGDLVEVVGL